MLRIEAVIRKMRYNEPPNVKFPYLSFIIFFFFFNFPIKRIFPLILFLLYFLVSYCYLVVLILWSMKFIFLIDKQNQFFIYKYFSLLFSRISTTQKHRKFLHLFFGMKNKIFISQLISCFHRFRFVHTHTTNLLWHWLFILVSTLNYFYCYYT